MKAHILLAQVVHTHSDGSVSMLQGGVNGAFVPRGEPLVFQGGAIVWLVPSASELGKHDVKIVCADEDGRVISTPFTGVYEVAQANMGKIVGIPLRVELPKPGRYTFSLAVDRQETDYHTISVQFQKG